jgi:hypothetical protein
MSKKNKDPWGLLRAEEDERVGPQSRPVESAEDSFFRTFLPGTPGYERQIQFEALCERVSQLMKTKDDYERLLGLEEETHRWYEAVHLVFEMKFKDPDLKTT